ncbi:hypothetical protein A9P82_12720 [Arachidicoccus ginsenosidimutans]|uniref:hypothetical protein n=1 Tax=Arachidicoccus sp. BS20 TaxID=1850526 RepID=UPI0007F1363F|nr:hypothetical protein [Arachidicoccus sp. BS20]ANI90071.1 hypothetical protein A9P82_12720 [Arachidicoccus sp. BS20]
MKLKVKQITGSVFLAGLILNTQSLFAQALKDKTSFQIADAWDSAYDVRSDVVMVYGVNDAGGHFEERVKGWRSKGYNVQFMTGSAWGQYKDYFLGQYDGKKHFDEGQQMKNGDIIWHGENVPYVVPSLDYIRYLETHIKRAIDAGVSAIYLEEPEFWARSGYSPAFKAEWKSYYGTDWQPEDTSPEATYLASKLKYHLYYRALDSLFTYAKTYSKSKGLDVKCYVPTHSLLNYSSWQIVSPEASLAALKNVDGYIAQVWTGTSREPVYFNGRKKERVFENAFLEYGSMVSMTAPTGRRVYFLTDPIEDRARTWDDYKRNYQATFTAELMYPMVDHFEVMPWPSRIYLGKFKMDNSDKKQPILPTYATQMQVMVNSLNNMPLSKNEVSGSKGIGVLVANSMMFQRFPTHAGYDDPQLSNFYGMAMPLLERGVPVNIVHMENLGYEKTLKNIKVLVMSYANLKPLSAEEHSELAAWVKKGGVLLYYGRDDDPFQSVKEWWNTNGNHYKTASEDLFAKLDVHYQSGKEAYPSGKGKVYIVREDPKELVLQQGHDSDFISLIKNAYEKDAKAGMLQFKNNFVLQRGSYIIASVLADAADKTPLELKQPVIDLFDPELPVLNAKEILPGQQAFLYDLKNINRRKPAVLAAAARIYNEKADYKNRFYTFRAKSPSNTINAMRIVLPRKPEKIFLTLSNQESLQVRKSTWDETSHTLLLKFDNYSSGVDVKIRW